MNVLRSILEALRRFLARRESIKDGAVDPLFVPMVVPPPPPELSARAEPQLPILQRLPLQAFAGPLAEIPRNRAAVIRTFGDPGMGATKADPKWERQYMTVATGLPGTWNGGKGRLYVHRLAEEYVREALRRCEEAGVLSYITRLGCFNFRHMRHDARMPLSYHSWGIALDVNSGANAGRYVDHPPAPFTDAWRALWPLGMPEALVQAFESTGWRWGGRWRGYVDPMHFQLCG